MGCIPAAHEIQKVDAGTRITLSYKLLRPEAVTMSNSSSSSAVAEVAAPDAVSEAASSSSSSSSAVEQASSASATTSAALPSNPCIPTQIARSRAQGCADCLQQALRSESFFPDGGRLAFPCFHLYEQEEDLPTPAQLGPGIKASDIKLRGADALLAVVAARAGLAVEILRYSSMFMPEPFLDFQYVNVNCALLYSYYRLLHIDNTVGGVWAAVDVLPSVSNAARGLCELGFIDDCYFALGVNSSRFCPTGYDHAALEEVKWAVSLPHYRGTPGVLSTDACIPRTKLLDVYISGTKFSDLLFGWR